MSTLVQPPAWWEKQISMAKVRAILQRDDGYENVVRVAPETALTPMQMCVAKLLAQQDKTHADIAGEMGISLRAVKLHVEKGAEKIPGKLPVTVRVMLWYQGASLQLLTGSPPQQPVRQRP